MVLIPKVHTDLPRTLPHRQRRLRPKAMPRGSDSMPRGVPTTHGSNRHTKMGLTLPIILHVEAVAMGWRSQEEAVLTSTCVPFNHEFGHGRHGIR